MTTLNRRAFITTAAIAPLAGVAMADDFNENDNLELLIAISNHTGLSLDDVTNWFEGVPTPMLEKIMYNVLKAPKRKWSYQASYTAALAIMAGEAFDDPARADPNKRFCARQLVLKGDSEAIKKVVRGYVSSGCKLKSLMEFA